MAPASAAYSATWVMRSGHTRKTIATNCAASGEELQEGWPATTYTPSGSGCSHTRNGASRGSHSFTRTWSMVPAHSYRSPVGSGASFGGSVTHAHELIRAWAQLEIDVVPMTTDDAIAATAEEDPDPPCHWRVLKVGTSLNALPASAAVADDLALVRGGIRAHADLIYQRHGRFSLCGAMLARLSGRPLFLEYNASEAFTGRYWNKTPLTRQLARCEQAVLSAAAKIFVVSEVGRRELIDRGIPAERIVLNPNGVSPGRFTNGGGAALRRELGLSADDTVVGFVGSFGPWHGAPSLARALGRLWADLPGLRAVFVGDGPELDQVTEEIRAGGGAGATRFAGRVHPSDVPRWLDACDILVSPQVPLPFSDEGLRIHGRREGHRRKPARSDWRSTRTRPDCPPGRTW